MLHPVLRDERKQQRRRQQGGKCNQKSQLVSENR